MKILKIFGIVAGIHALAFLLILANPGCSSTSKPPPAPADTAAKVDPAPTIGLPAATPAPEPATGPIVAAPVSVAADTPVIAAGLFSPTRPGTLAAGALEAQPESDVTPATTYVVGKGDNLWSIARKNKLKVSALAKANGIGTGTPLHVGQKLIIPGPASASALPSPAPRRTSSPAAPAASSAAAPGSGGSLKYTIRPGESLGSIARKFHVKVGELALRNNISDPQTIHVGEELVIPERHPGGSHAARDAAAAAPAPVPQQGGAPSPDQDLDAGLKPAAPGDIPVIRIDGAAAPEGQAKP